jgi:hypothetical protein
MLGAAELAVLATMNAPYEFGCESRTFYYLGGVSAKSRIRLSHLMTSQVEQKMGTPA